MQHYKGPFLLPFVSPQNPATLGKWLLGKSSAKQGPQGSVTDPPKPSTIRVHSAWCHIYQGLSSCESELCSSEKKSGAVPVLTCLPLGHVHSSPHHQSVQLGLFRELGWFYCSLRLINNLWPHYLILRAHPLGKPMVVPLQVCCAGQDQTGASLGSADAHSDSV